MVAVAEEAATTEGGGEPYTTRYACEKTSMALRCPEGKVSYYFVF